MSNSFIIPSIFTAVDRLTAPIRNMSAGVLRFANKFSNKLFPALSETTRQMFDFAKSAAIASAAIGFFAYSTGKIIEFDKALASFRTIVSDLTDVQFQDFKGAIFDVAKQTRASSIDVVNSFEKIAGLNAKFAETSKGLAEVSKAAIILAKASGSDLTTSAENLVGIMNQFNLSAQEANRTINVLAAGQAVGAASIDQTAQAFVNFGSVASGANISLEQSVGLIQTLGKFSILGAEAGTKLRGSILMLQRAGVGYKSGQFRINDALFEAQARIQRLSSAKAKDAALTKMFGAENITTGRILLNNIELFKSFTASVTGTTEAQKAAAINSNTLSNRIEELKNKWVTLLTSNTKVSESLGMGSSLLTFLTNNMESIIVIAALYIGVFTILKAITLAAAAASNIAAAAQWVWNVAMAANPVTVIILVIIALIAIIRSLVSNWHLVTKAFQEHGILSAILAIGKVLLDVILWPLQQILEIAGHLPGKMGDWALAGAEGIKSLRMAMGTLESPTAPALNPKTTQNDAVAQQMFSMFQKNEIELKVKTEKGTTVEKERASGSGKINLTSTTAAF